MDISELANLTTVANSGSGLQIPSEAMGKDAFMQLLVAQLQNQDPFEPMENSDFVAQLAQFSSLEQAETTNANLDTLAGLEYQTFQLMSLAEGSSLIGKEVVYFDPATETKVMGKVEALEVIDGTVTLRIGEKNVPLGYIVQVSPGAEE